MRNRTEAVTNNLPDDSEEDEEALDNSEDDWQPEEDEKPKKRKSGGSSAGGSAKKAKNGAKGGARAAKKRKKAESEEEEESEGGEEESEEEPAPKKKGGAKKKKQEEEYDSEEDSGDDTGNTPAKKGGAGGKNFPDKQGFLSLYIFRGDLVNGIKANENLCLWRRDGSSLLQKYLRDKNQSEPQWSPSMVYSCWEDRRKDEYLEVKVLCKGDLKNSNVTIVDLENLEDQCVRERDENAKFVSQKPQSQGGAGNNSQMANTSQEGMGEDEGDDGEEE